jgi:uncharacterized protein
MNPFLYQNACTGNHFCYREKELGEMDALVGSGASILLYSKRKYGKTSLIHEFFDNRVDAERYITIYVDLFGITDSADFAKLFYRQITYAVPYDYRIVLKKLKELFLRVNFTATMKEDGELEFLPKLCSYNIKELMADINKGLDRIAAETGKRIVVAFDEFQQLSQIKDMDTEGLFARYIEKYPDITYIFTGLKRHLLTGFFSKKRSQLYPLVQPLELKSIPIRQFYDFVNEKFDGRLPYEHFEHIYTMTEGESRLIQEFCYHLYHNGRTETVTREEIDYVCQLLLEGKSDYFKMLLDRLSLPLKIALKAVIISDGRELYTKEHLFALRTTKSSLSTAVRHLYRDEIIDKEGGRYFITNKCFELWCKKKFLLS